jgi:hypothetical protein
MLWVIGSALGVVAALTALGGAYANGEFVPASGDAFYHARRILDAVFSGNPVSQFDPLIHVPEGSWLTWPWGFDTLLASITGWFGPFANEAGANRVLMNIPPAAMPVAMALAVVIARQLVLPFALSCLFVLAFAALPLVHQLFGVGNIDHHFAELLWTLGTISAGIRFFQQRESTSAGVVLGLVLGSAVAIHNGLFVLQVPVAAALALTWLRGFELPCRRSMFAFAAALGAMTGLACVFSDPWREGFFEFYTLSWFHFYVATCVAVFAIALVLVPRTTRNVGLLAVAALAALVPLLSAMPLGGDFVTGDLEAIRAITEAQSPYTLHRLYGEAMSTRLLSWLMWLSMPMLLINLWWVIRGHDATLQFVAVVGVIGLALMQAQIRFAVFGVASLVLTPLMAAQLLISARPTMERTATLACVALFAAAMYPTLENWRTRWALGGDYVYSVSRSTFPVLEKLCDRQPGIVLGDINVGHWVRYHSKCSVIGDVFLLTPQHAAKAAESKRLMQLTPAQLLADAHRVVYVFAHHDEIVSVGNPGQETPDLDAVRQSLAPLTRDLLGSEAALPTAFSKQWEVLTPGGQVYARLYKIDRPT